MYDIVEGTLGKGAVDIAEGQETLFGHTSGEGNGMSLGNAYIEGAFRHLVHHDIHRAACRHSGRDTNDLFVLFSQFKQRLAKDVLEPWRFV